MHKQEKSKGNKQKFKIVWKQHNGGHRRVLAPGTDCSPDSYVVNDLEPLCNIEVVNVNMRLAKRCGLCVTQWAKHSTYGTRV